MLFCLFKYQSFKTLCFEIQIEYSEKKNQNDLKILIFQKFKKIESRIQFFQILQKIRQMIYLNREIIASSENQKIQKRFY